MIHLLLAILSSAMVALVMRISEKYTDKNKNIAMLATNYIVCIGLAILYTGTENLMKSGTGSGLGFGLGILNGLFYMLGFVLLQLNVKKNGVVMSSTFMRLGVLVPTIMSILVFGEMPTILQIAGFVLALIAIVLISSDGGAEKSAVEFKLGLILVLLAGGSADGMAKVYKEVGNPEFSDQFLVYTFLFACLFCLIFLAMKKQRFGKREILCGIIIAIPNYYSARFLLKAVASVPAVVAYPTYSVGTIITISLAGVLFFHEKINGRQRLALAMILAAIALLNI